MNLISLGMVTSIVRISTWGKGAVICPSYLARQGKHLIKLQQEFHLPYIISQISLLVGSERLTFFTQRLGCDEQDCAGLVRGRISF